MLRLSIIFLVFVINTTITHYFTVKGTWENLLFESMSLSMILVFLFYYVSFVIEEKEEKNRRIKRKILYISRTTSGRIIVHLFLYD